VIDSLRRAIYYTLKAGWYWVFGGPAPHVHKFAPYWAAPHTLIRRCSCGAVGPHECLSPSGVCIHCDPRFKIVLGESPVPTSGSIRVTNIPRDVFATKEDDAG